MSDSGNSSKFDVSSMLLISIGIAAGLSLFYTHTINITETVETRGVKVAHEEDVLNKV